MDEKTIQRIKKLQALAERGVGGEKTTAQKKLAKLLKDNGINSLDELQKEEYEYTIFSYNGKHEIKLLRQCMYKVMGAKSDRTAYKPYGRRQKIGIYCTKAQKIEIELEFEFYRNVFYEELSTFMDAFIQAQKIFPEDAPVGDYDEFNEMYELRLLAGNGYTQELTAYEKTRLVERTKAALIRAKEEDGLEIQGKMRDLVAAMINESSTNVARMDAINNNATPEIKEQLKEGKLGITAAYEAAKLGEDEQREIAEKAAAGENVRAKEIAEKVAEKKAGDDYETPHPESITSLCYSCQKYKDCNVKTGTCQKCDQYINKAEAEKTDEQRYSEEQDAIDRQTKKKLQERADAEKMEHLPSEGNTEHKQHEIKIAASYYEDVVSGKKGFELRKNDRGYKQGDSLKMLEFKDGKHTGRTIDADIIYMLEDYTGLTEGYCILGIRVTDYTGKVSETDTESGAENV